MHFAGVDCATNPRDVGVALAEFDDKRGVATVCEVRAGIMDPWNTAAKWLSDHEVRDALVALDAPLGWPVSLSEALRNHSAGEPVGKCPNEIFRRTTDHHVKQKTGRQPLDVGADRIARTACATLRELDPPRDRICRAIPLAWHKECLEGVHAIEVYPAATLRSHGLTCAGYKKEGDSEHRRLREGIADGLPNVEIPNRMRETTLMGWMPWYASKRQPTSSAVRLGHLPMRMSLTPSGRVGYGAMTKACSISGRRLSDLGGMHSADGSREFSTVPHPWYRATLKGPSRHGGRTANSKGSQGA